MDLAFLPSLVAFAFVTSVTPGPNNLMLMASGANYGFRRSIPHMLGVCIGFILMVAIVGVGLMQIFDAVPIIHTILTYAGAAYLLWLAWHIARSQMPDTTQTNGRPLTFLEAAIFQWVNPKAWQMALTAITLYAPQRGWPAVVFVAIIFGLVNLPSVSLWTILGQQMRRILSSRPRLIVFNWSMAILLVATLIPVM